MNVYLVRHGEAAAVGGHVLRDADRPLTPRGESDIVLMAEALAKLDGRVALILASPLVRAQQTAQILAGKLHGGPPVLTTENLAPGFRPKALLAEIAASGTPAGIVAVGHQPDMGVFLSYLVADASHAAVAFSPGAAAKVAVHFSPGGRDATLHWLLTPEAVHRLSARQEGGST
jgi:phosphohistidine phosphatase